MDTKRLCNALEETLKAIRPMPTLGFNMVMHDANRGSVRANPRAVELLQLLRSEPELHMFDGATIHTSTNGASWARWSDSVYARHFLELWSLAAWLLSRAKSVGVSQAVENLATYLAASELPCEITSSGQILHPF